MYLDFFNLQELPFRLAPQPRFLYWSAGHAGAVACLRSARTRQNGCAALVAPRGAGKTTLFEWLAHDESPGTVTRLSFLPRSEFLWTKAEVSLWLMAAIFSDKSRPMEW